MSERIQFAEGGFAFLKGVFPYSQGVVALPGYAIERVRFRKPVPVAAGFARIGKYLKSLGRPLTAFCACELRSPRPFTFEGFREFNEGYVEVLREWKLFRDGVNPVARSNVAPAIEPPEEPCFHAFSYTVRPGDGRAGFVVAGSGEWPEGGRFPDSGGTGPGYSPPEPSDLPVLLGDVVICPKVAAVNAPDHAGTYDDELALLLVHGILHLLGMDHLDDEEAEEMEARERELLARFHRPPA